MPRPVTHPLSLPGTLRQLPPEVADGESCSLHLIADHLFHRAVGGAHISATVAYMTNIVSLVDRVYRSTTWGGSGGRQFKNVGVHIANVGGHQWACPDVGVAVGCTSAPPGLQVTVLTEPDGMGYNFEGSPDQEVVAHQLLAVSGRGLMLRGCVLRPSGCVLLRPLPPRRCPMPTGPPIVWFTCLLSDASLVARWVWRTLPHPPVTGWGACARNVRRDTCAHTDLCSLQVAAAVGCFT